MFENKDRGIKYDGKFIDAYCVKDNSSELEKIMDEKWVGLLDKCGVCKIGM